MNNQDLPQCKKILERMMKHPFAGPFLEPVDPVALGIPDYLLIIKHPMDFGTISNKMSQGAYQDKIHFVNDMKLVFNNCRTYNMPGSEIYRMADILATIFDKSWGTVFPDESLPKSATTFHGVNFSTPQPNKKRGRPKGSKNKRSLDDFDENSQEEDEFSDDSQDGNKGNFTDPQLKTRSRRRSSRHGTEDAEFDAQEDEGGPFGGFKKDRPKRNSSVKHYTDFYDDALYEFEEELITDTTPSKPKKAKGSPPKPAEDAQPLDPTTVTVSNDVLVIQPETPPPKPKAPKETGPVLSPYELARLKNIERNRELMKQLQLDALSSSFNKTLNPQATTESSDPNANAANYTPRKVKPKYLMDPSQRRVSKRNKGFELTPLYMSIRDRDHERFNQLMAGQIISNGKKIPLEVNKKQGVNDETCLHLACDIGDELVVKALLQCDDIDVNAKDHRGWGPLDAAKSNGFHGIIQMLQAQGAQSYLQHTKKPLQPRVWAPTGFGPVQEPTGGRCSCCHICRSSLSRRPNEFKACSSCSYIFCRPCCTKKLGLEWDTLKSNHSWMCEVCMGRCLCSRCITRGPPKWFGWKNPDWNDPTTVEEQKKLYINKVKQRQIQMGYDVVDLKIGQLPQKPPQLEDSENQTNENDNNGQVKEEGNQEASTEPDGGGTANNNNNNNSNGPAANGSCSCCHVCRRSMKSYPRPFKPCSTCAYIVCVNCFGTRVKESWEHVKGLAQWSCPVCNGVCSCSRCKTRGPPAWFGNKKKAAAANQKAQQQQQAQPQPATATAPVKKEVVPPANVPAPVQGESEHSDGEGESDSEDNEENSENEEVHRFADDDMHNDSMNQLNDTSDLGIASEPLSLPQASDDLLPSFNFDYDPIGINHHL